MDGGQRCGIRVVVVVFANKFAVLLLFFDVEACKEFDPNRGSVGINGCVLHLTSYANFNGKMFKLSQKGNWNQIQKILLCETKYPNTFDTLDTFQGNKKITIISIIRFLQL